MYRDVVYIWTHVKYRISEIQFQFSGTAWWCGEPQTNTNTHTYTQENLLSRTKRLKELPSCYEKAELHDFQNPRIVDPLSHYVTVIACDHSFGGQKVCALTLQKTRTHYTIFDRRQECRIPKIPPVFSYNGTLAARIVCSAKRTGFS